TSVREPIPGLGVSNTVRGAVASWAKSLSRELGADGITVNNILPGYTDTDRLHQIFANAAKKKGHELQTEVDSRLAEVPLGRFAEPDEIAAAVAFLASPEAAYVSGINLAVDGGRSRGA
ncbi:MAG: SDR family oxidoreductase, partial [Gammaproteobacteria bacterium]|nr:SDR family oxidoreductase [Gammaproteobacteria bacterium]